MPRVAVIVPVYNPGDYLRIALQSLFEQTFSDWECAVIDDGSVEDLAWVAEVHENVHLIRQTNSGVSAARNRGIAETSAPLIAFLDQDDEWLPAYLSRQVQQFDDDEGVVLSSTAFEIMDAAGCRVGPGFEGHNGSYEELLSGCGLHLSTVMARRTAVIEAGGFRPFLVSQDWDLWLRIARAGGALARVEETLGRWRAHDNNGSRDYKLLLRDAKAILASHSHPAARQGLRRVRHLSGVQAFDRARQARQSPRELIAALAWAMTHAPGFTARSLLLRGRAAQRAAIRP
jgi:GT2 family glycosyltransferase